MIVSIYITCMIVRNVFNLTINFWFKFSYENTILLNMLRVLSLMAETLISTITCRKYPIYSQKNDASQLRLAYLLVLFETVFARSSCTVHKHWCYS